MTLLESAMAFAVVMIIFSTIVTGIVEAILRSLGTRERNLRKTIEALFDKVVWPRLGATLERAIRTDPASTGNRNLVSKVTFGRFGKTTNLKLHRDNFVRDLTENPVVKPGNRFNPERKSKIDALSLLAFAERLGKSDVGKAIAAEGEVQVNLLVDDLARSFDRFGRASKEVFRKKAQLTAIMIAIPFAWVTNIDASRLFVQLVNNPEIRTGFIEQAEAAQNDNEIAVSRLEDLKMRLDKLQSTPGTGPQTMADNTAAAEENTLQEQLREVSEKVQQSLGKLEAQGLEIGWQYYPFCAAGNSDKDCNGREWQVQSIRELLEGVRNADFWPIVNTVQFFNWLVMSTLAGVLIGLGGPFWFRVFTSLSQVFQALRALGLGSRKPARAEAPPPEEAAEDSAKPKSVIDAFNVAVAVNLKSSALSRGRALLGPDGHPLQPTL